MLHRAIQSYAVLSRSSRTCVMCMIYRDKKLNALSIVYYMHENIFMLILLIIDRHTIRNNSITNTKYIAIILPIAQQTYSSEDQITA